MHICAGWIKGVRQVPTPFFNKRPVPLDISLIVIHCIALPPKTFNTPYVDDLFVGKLDKDAHPYFQDIYNLELSTHLFINRQGNITQYVSFLDRAWHAGRSIYKNKKECNDYGIGIELEGSDDLPYTKEQYETLDKVIDLLKQTYIDIKDNIVAHSEIAPKRKTDPGIYFDWSRYR